VKPEKIKEKDIKNLTLKIKTFREDSIKNNFLTPFAYQIMKFTSVYTKPTSTIQKLNVLSKNITDTQLIIDNIKFSNTEFAIETKKVFKTIACQFEFISKNKISNLKPKIYLKNEQIFLDIKRDDKEKKKEEEDEILQNLLPSTTDVLSFEENIEEVIQPYNYYYIYPKNIHLNHKDMKNISIEISVFKNENDDKPLTCKKIYFFFFN
jgi:hypothetical protein